MAKKNDDNKEQLINCLKNEKVKVRFISKKRGSTDDPNSPLYGGLATTSKCVFVVPRLRSGILKNVLTNDEKAFIEDALGLEKDAMSVYKQTDNYWCTSTPGCINKVILGKQEVILDLSDINDYIKYKILLANNDRICPSLREWEDAPKNTYMFVMINESAEAASVGKKANLKYECFMLYHKYKDNISVLRCIVELVEGKKVAAGTKLEYLQNMVTNLIETDKHRFKDIVSDKYLEYKALIKDAVEKGIINNRNGLYYLKEDSTPLSEEYDEPRLNNAAKYLAEPANQDLKNKIEYLLKN
jgi:hypothetical protein